MLEDLRRQRRTGLFRARIHAEDAEGRGRTDVGLNTDTVVRSISQLDEIEKQFLVCLVAVISRC